MPNSFLLTLDTLGPAGVTLSINNDALYTANQAATLTIGTTDASTAGYSMKIWGNVVGAATEDAAEWQTFTTNKAVTLSDGDGLKTIYLKVRDAVWNESTAVYKTITLNTSIPVVTIVGPNVQLISKIVGKNTSNFTFSVDQGFMAYKIGVVPAENSPQNACEVIPTTGGSVNMSGNEGSYPEEENISCTITGADLQTAVGGSDGEYIIKVFVQNDAGTWSV